MISAPSASIAPRLSLLVESVEPTLLFLPCPQLLFSLQPYLVRFRAVVHERLLEPRVLQRVLGRDALFGVVYEDPLQQIEELPIELGVGRDRFLAQSAHVQQHGHLFELTCSFFMAFTNFFEPFWVSGLG